MHEMFAYVAKNGERLFEEFVGDERRQVLDTDSCTVRGRTDTQSTALQYLSIELPLGFLRI